MWRVAMVVKGALLLAALVVSFTVACTALPVGGIHVAGYELDTTLPEDVADRAWVYRVTEAATDDAWARQVATALGFVGEPSSHSQSAAQFSWSWSKARSSQGIQVYGDIAFQCSSPPAGDTGVRSLDTGAEAAAVARNWLTEHDLLPADCGEDVEPWQERAGTGWEISFRRRLDGLPVGSHWSWTGGLRVHLSSVGQVDRMTYVRRNVEQDRLVSIKTAQAAWTELQRRGPAFFDPEGPDFPQYGVFAVTEVGLGYCEGAVGTAERQTALKPYYVFGGEAVVPNAGQKVRMAAYVPAWK